MFGCLAVGVVSTEFVVLAFFFCVGCIATLQVEEFQVRAVWYWEVVYCFQFCSLPASTFAGRVGFVSVRCFAVGSLVSARSGGL